MKTILSRPLFQSGKSEYYESTMNKDGGYYNHFFVYTEKAMAMLREFFPDGRCDCMNLIFFSTSGVHGMYTTIEEVQKTIEAGFLKDADNDSCPTEITFVYLCPRLATLYYGNCEPKTMDDIYFLKALRESSWEAAVMIGRLDDA